MLWSGQQIVSRGVLLLATLFAGVAIASGAALAETFTCSADPCEGTSSADVITGTLNAETINGRGGADQISAREENDRLNGQGGDDTLNGELGNDKLSGGPNNDTMDGGDGNDSYRFGDNRGEQHLERLLQGRHPRLLPNHNSLGVLSSRASPTALAVRGRVTHYRLRRRAPRSAGTLSRT